MTREQLEEIFGDHDVVPLLLELWDVMQIWDDAQDGDENDFAKGFETTFISMFNNPLYHQLNINFLFTQVFYDWHAANVFESEGIELHKAYMLRAGWYRLLVSLVHMIQGKEAAKNAAPIVYKAYGETFEEYAEEFKNA